MSTLIPREIADELLKQMRQNSVMTPLMGPLGDGKVIVPKFAVRCVEPKPRGFTEVVIGRVFRAIRRDK